MVCKNRKDVFHAWMVEGATFDGKWDIPTIPSADSLPLKVLSFDEMVSGKGCYESWVHFYQDDHKFERLWNQPDAYLERLRKYKGVISPDFSLYLDMPLAMQVWNTYRNRSIGYWLAKTGLKVIPNVRWGDERTYEFCFAGIIPGSVVAVGTHGCIKRTVGRKYFLQGFRELTSRLSPKAIVVYGRAPDELFALCKEAGIMIKRFDSSFHESHHKKAA
jgi:hypothetical protein